MSIEFEVSDFIPASPEAIYAAWLNSDEHTEMTGSPAKVSPEVGGTFEAWDGYIQGVNLELDPPTRILQLWRTSEFEDSDEASRLEIVIKPERDGSHVLIRHSNIPAHGMQYQQGWIDAYFVPMQDYFTRRSQASAQ